MPSAIQQITAKPANIAGVDSPNNKAEATAQIKAIKLAITS